MKLPYHFGPHIRRWNDLGFDSQAALDRFETFKAAFATADTRERIALSLAYCREEEAAARKAGVNEEDPDFWRVMALPRLWDALG